MAVAEKSLATPAAGQSLAAAASSAKAHRPVHDPTYLYDLVERMFAVDLMIATLGHLSLFEIIARQASTLEQLCVKLSLAPRTANVLLTMLCAQSLLSRSTTGVYSVTDYAREYLLVESPYSLVACFEALKDRPSCLAVLDVLRTGKPMGWQGAGPLAFDDPEHESNETPGPAMNGDSGAPEDWLSGMGEEAFAEYFLEAIDSRNGYLSEAVARTLDLSGCKAVLDIAGGSGIYSCALARQNSGVSFTVLEKAPTDAVGRRAIERRGFMPQVSVLAFDILDEAPLPGGYDLHFLSNVVHDWDEATVLALLRSSYEALGHGGRIVIHDSILGTEADACAVAEYSALLACFTTGRCYAVDELRDLLHQAGFVHVCFTPTAVHRSLLSATKLL